MPQVVVNSPNIDVFAFSALFDIYNRKVRFTDISTYTSISGSGSLYVKGIGFSLIDQQGITLAEIDFNSPQISPQNGETFYDLDLSALSLPFLFQTYKIVGAIKDQDDNVYYTSPVYKKVCMPEGINESGYVPGLFNVTANCPDNVITVKDITPFIYNNQIPVSVTKTGTLSYPTGTISSVSFTGTPFSNNVIYTGQYRIACTTVAKYDLGDEVYVDVSYITNNVFEVTCQNKIADLICCMVDLQTTAIKQCNNAVGKNAQQKLAEVSVPFLIGLTKEINGQDASNEAAIIRKTLNCSCGSGALQQNEFTPINPSVTNIVISGVGGTTVAPPTVNGSTKTFFIASNVYQVVKGDTGDLAFSISIDTATQYIVKYKITFNYGTMAGYILDAIGTNPTLLSQLNSLVTQTGLNLSGLDGKCVVNTSACTYILVKEFPAGVLWLETDVTNIVINGVTYAAPVSTGFYNIPGFQSWLNSLGLGTFAITVNAGDPNILLIQSANNSNIVLSLTYTPQNTSVPVTVPFANNCANLLSILQAIIDFLCELTDAQVKLSAQLLVFNIDYNGDPISTTYAAGVAQANFNAGVSVAIENIVNWITNLTGLTCAKLQAIFLDRPNSVFSATSRVYGLDGSNCIAWSDKQLALGVIAAIQAYADVKAAFCAIDCTSPALCPDISDISLAMVVGNIGLYGVTWASTTVATQTVSVWYKLNSSSTWLLATNSLQILANGNISGTTPFQIGGIVAGSTYDVRVVNNCGGVGFSKQITAPTGTVYSGSFIYDPIIYNLCGNTPVTLYSSAPFAPGVIMYSDAGLTTPVTGQNYIASMTNGEIFEINSATGEVGVDTASSCNNGVAGVYILGNNTLTICAGVSGTKYTNGAFAVGGTLYSDSGLTSPVTGFSYVVNTSNNKIYNLNTLTGQIGADTGLTCGVYIKEYVASNSSVISCAAATTNYYTAAEPNPGVTVYTDAGLTTPLTGFTFILFASTGDIYTINPVTGVLGAISGVCT